MFDFPNPFSADALGRAFILGVCGWVLIWKWVSKHAPQVTDTAKQKGAEAAVGFIARLFKR